MKIEPETPTPFAAERKAQQRRVNQQRKQQRERQSPAIVAHRLLQRPSLTRAPRITCDDRIDRAVLVGVRGFEPPTSCSQSKRATGLRYTPSDHYAIAKPLNRGADVPAMAVDDCSASELAYDAERLVDCTRTVAGCDRMADAPVQMVLEKLQRQRIER